jgi:hypothetical protein
MAAATAVTSYVVALGPIKVEFVTGTFASSTDTYASKLQRPLFAFAQKNVSGTAQTTTSISGKTVTVTDAGISASAVHLLIVGF